MRVVSVARDTQLSICLPIYLPITGSLVLTPTPTLTLALTLTITLTLTYHRLTVKEDIGVNTIFQSRGILAEFKPSLSP